MAQQLGGEVAKTGIGEYGRTIIRVGTSSLMHEWPARRDRGWMSHGDAIRPRRRRASWSAAVARRNGRGSDRGRRRGRFTPCSSIPRSPTPNGARKCWRTSCTTWPRLPSDMDEHLDHRRARSQAIKQQVGYEKVSSARCPAAWTRRSRPRSYTRRSANNSPASSSTPG